MSFSLNECFENMNEGNVILSYKGSISAELITSVLGLIELKLDNTDEKPNIKKRIYNVLVESLQNLFHHIDEPDESLRNELGQRFGVFVISKVSNGYLISTGNLIKSEKKEELKSRIDKINMLSKDEIKEYYKFILNNQKFSEKGGGGLGLIDIAKRTSRKLDYSFTKLNNTFDFFNLKIFISNN
jgi:hypothetical protein